ncbi:MAG: exodeoxyribonuclease VII large subunit [Bacillota bacterium]|nr:exodeoxyribonuclease VII large subunit [Bacillota bacterium]
MVNDFITVEALNAYIGRLFETDDILQNFWLKGEISGFRCYQQSGHMYFTLKDEQAAVSCVMFKSCTRGLKFKPEDGMEVLLRGTVAMYGKQGKVQVYAEEMQPFGTGGMFLYLEKLKKRLKDEGCFDPEKKKELPPMANKIGIVTSQDGAALRDILRVLKLRHPGVEVVIAHSSVQGTEAPAEIARGIQLINTFGDIDIIIVGRGGGSFEDLMAFNSETVVYAIVDSVIPVISAVGHEVDFSLSDFAADMRAATPTQAAALAVPDYRELEERVCKHAARLQRLMERNLSLREEALDRIMMKRVWREPALLLEKKKNMLDDCNKKLSQAMQDILIRRGHTLAMAAGGLDKLSPLQVLGRGYAILGTRDHIVKSIDDINSGDEIYAELIDGTLKMEMKGKEKRKKWNR